MFGWIKDIWDKTKIVVTGVAEEIAKNPIIRKGIGSVPIVGGIASAVLETAHHSFDRAKDYFTQSKLNSLSDAQGKLGSNLTTLQGSLSEANKNAEALQRELNSLSQDNIQQREQIVQALAANEHLKEYLENSIAITEKNISEIQSQMTDFHQAQTILQNDLLSEKEKITQLQHLADQEKERLSRFEAQLQSFEQDLKENKTQITLAFSRLDFLEQKVDNVQELANKSAQEVAQLITRVHALESEKEQRDQLSIVSEIQSLREHEAHLLSQLALLTDQRELFQSSNDSQEEVRLFDIQPGQAWLPSTLSSITEPLPISSESYDYYYKKYGAHVMKNWIRTENGSPHSSSQPSDRQKLWQKNHSLVKQALLAVQCEIAAKIALLKDHPELVPTCTSEITVLQLSQEIEQSQSRLAQERLIYHEQENKASQSHSEHLRLKAQEVELKEQLKETKQTNSFFFDWILKWWWLLLILLLPFLFLFWPAIVWLLKMFVKLIVFFVRTIFGLITKFFSRYKPIKIAKSNGYYERIPVTTKKNILLSKPKVKLSKPMSAFKWFLVGSCFLSAVISGILFTYDYSQHQSAHKHQLKTIQQKILCNKEAQDAIDLQKAQSQQAQAVLRNEIDDSAQKILQTTRDQVLELTKVSSKPITKPINSVPAPLTSEELKIIEQFLEENNYQYTTFLEPLEYRIKLSSFTEYLNYIKFHKKPEPNIEKDKPWVREQQEQETNYVLSLKPFLEYDQINFLQVSFGSLAQFFTRVEHICFLNYLHVFQSEKEAFLRDKLKYEGILPSYSDRLFIELNSLHLSKKVYSQLAKIGIVPSKEEFASFRLKKT